MSKLKVSDFLKQNEIQFESSNHKPLCWLMKVGQNTIIAANLLKANPIGATLKIPLFAPIQTWGLPSQIEIIISSAKCREKVRARMIEVEQNEESWSIQVEWENWIPDIF